MPLLAIAPIPSCQKASSASPSSTTAVNTIPESAAAEPDTDATRSTAVAPAVRVIVGAAGMNAEPSSAASVKT